MSLLTFAAAGKACSSSSPRTVQQLKHTGCTGSVANATAVASAALVDLVKYCSTGVGFLCLSAAVTDSGFLLRIHSLDRMHSSLERAEGSGLNIENAAGTCSSHTSDSVDSKTSMTC